MKIQMAKRKSTRIHLDRSYALINPNFDKTTRVLTNDLKQFIKSKDDLYSILGIEGQFHLPPFEECTMEFLRDALRGQKKLIPNSNLRQVCVPRYKEFNASQLY